MDHKPEFWVIGFSLLALFCTGASKSSTWNTTMMLAEVSHCQNIQNYTDQVEICVSKFRLQTKDLGPNKLCRFSNIEMPYDELSSCLIETILMNGCFDESLTFDHILRKVAHPELFKSCKTSNYESSTKLAVGLMIALSCFLAVVFALLAHYFASIRD